MAFLCELIEAAEKEKLLLAVESGSAVLSVLAHIKLTMYQKATADFVAELVSRLSKCIYSKAHLATSSQIWSTFHLLRLDDRMFHQWESYLSSIDLPEKLKGAVGMALQVFLTRAMKKLIASCVGSHGDSQSHVSMLSLREKNAIITWQVM